MPKRVWTDEKINRLLDLRIKQWSRKKIAEELGVTTEAVCHKIRRLRKQGIKVEPIRNKVRGFCDPKWRAAHLEVLRMAAKESGLRFLKFNQDSEHQRKAGRRSRIWENKAAKELEKEFDAVFHPASVCDRICIGNGKIVFVEIKYEGRKLTPKQNEFKKICTRLGVPYKVARFPS